MSSGQKILTKERIEPFRTNKFALQQVNDFIGLIEKEDIQDYSLVVDVGGGIGAFAYQLVINHPFRVKVVDSDETSISLCKSRSQPNIEAMIGDALNPPVNGNEKIICFNLILHHLVGPSEENTRLLQKKALTAWLGSGRLVFVNEYVYESYWKDLSGRLIYEITSNRFLSRIASVFAAYIPSLKANTFGTGVRFRSQSEWIELFTECGYQLKGMVQGQDELISTPRKLLFLRTKRLDSFLLGS